MVVSDEEEDRISTSGDDDGHGEGNFDELIFLETSSVVDSVEQYSNGKRFFHKKWSKMTLSWTCD